MADGSSSARGPQAGSLPERILRELEASGPSYGGDLAERLGRPGAPLSSGAVSQALTSLRRRGYVEIIDTEPAGHGQRRIIYAARTSTAAEDQGQGAVDAAAIDARVAAELRRQLQLLELDRRVAHTDRFSRAVAELVASNRPVAGL